MSNKNRQQQQPPQKPPQQKPPDSPGPQEKPLRVITTNAGIGDNVWLMQKLINQNEKFIFHIPDGAPQRGKQLFDMLPQVSNGCVYTPNLNYKMIEANNVWPAKKAWANMTDQSFFISPNKHLEDGNRIETFLPDLKTSFRLDYVTDETDQGIARVLLPNKYPYVGIYTSAYSNARHWSGWTAVEWLQLIKQMNKQDVVFVMFGAAYDIGITQDLIKALHEHSIYYIDTVGQPLTVVVELLKRLNYFIGFPSGLSIMNESLGKDGCMMYPGGGKGLDGNKLPDYTKLMNSWADPQRISSMNYKGCIFPDPDQLYDWIRDSYKLYARI